MKRWFALLLSCLILVTACQGPLKTTPSPTVSSSSGTSAQTPTSSSSSGASNSSSPSEKPSGAIPEFNEKNTYTELWEGPVEHAFFHPLIIAPEKAFDGSYRERGFDDWMVTQDEMEKIFAHLYKGGFMLVKPSEVFKKINGRWQRNPKLRMPKGKKPMIISIDDLSYNEVYQGHGFSDKLVLAPDGKVTAEYTEKGVKKQARDHEIATYINQFVEKHPDFSWKGARGMLALTGYEGILGYRIQEGAPNRAAQIQAVKPVIEALRKGGWEFSSHSFSHDSINHLSMKKLYKDSSMWQEEVESLLGPTPFYTLPYGNMPEADALKKKMELLNEFGFHVIFAVGFESYIEPNPNHHNFIVQDRRAIDGLSMRTQGKLDDLFPVDDVFSPHRKEHPVGEDNSVY